MVIDRTIDRSIDRTTDRTSYRTAMGCGDRIKLVLGKIFRFLGRLIINVLPTGYDIGGDFSLAYVFLVGGVYSHIVTDINDSSVADCQFIEAGPGAFFTFECLETDPAWAAFTLIIIFLPAIQLIKMAMVAGDDMCEKVVYLLMALLFPFTILGYKVFHQKD